MYAGYMPEACLIYLYLFRISPKYAWYGIQMCLRYSKNMPETCTRCTFNRPETCLMFALYTMYEIYERDILEMHLRYD